MQLARNVRLDSVIAGPESKAPGFECLNLESPSGRRILGPKTSNARGSYSSPLFSDRSTGKLGIQRFDSGRHQNPFVCQHARPDWKERVKAAVEGRRPEVARPIVDEFEAKFHIREYPTADALLSRYARDRERGALLLLKCLSRRRSVRPSISVGVAGTVQELSILFGAGERRLSEAQGDWWFVTAQNEYRLPKADTSTLAEYQANCRSLRAHRVARCIRLRISETICANPAARSSYPSCGTQEGRKP